MLKGDTKLFKLCPFGRRLHIIFLLSMPEHLLLDQEASLVRQNPRLTPPPHPAHSTQLVTSYRERFHYLEECLGFNFSHMWKAFNFSSVWTKGQTHEWTVRAELGKVSRWYKPHSSVEKEMAQDCLLGLFIFLLSSSPVPQRAAFLLLFSLYYTKNCFEQLRIAIVSCLWQRPSLIMFIHSFYYNEPWSTVVIVTTSSTSNKLLHKSNRNHGQQVHFDIKEFNEFP